MKIFKFLFLYFIILLLNNQQQSLYCNAQNQIACFENFIKTIGQQDILPSVTTIDTICALENVDCDITSTQITGLYFNQNSDNIIIDQLACFNNLKNLSLSNAYLGNDFLSSENTFSSSSVSLTFNSPQLFRIPTDLFSSKIFSIVMYISNIYTHNTQFSLDIFNTIQNINLIDTSGGNQNIMYTSATKDNFLQRDISLFSKNLPSIDKMTNVSSIAIDLQTDFDVSSISNYHSYSDVSKSISIKTNINQKLCFVNDVIEGIDKMKTSKLNLIICLSSPSVKIDLSKNYGSLTHLDIQLSGNTNQDFQFSAVPPSLVSFKMSNTNFVSLSLPYIVLSNVTTVDLSFNQISDQVLPVYNVPTTNKIKTLNLSNNQLTGTLDQSYCLVPKLIITNNQLHGTLNDCFLCYMKDQIFANNFKNNSFTNLGSVNNSCFGKIVPRLRVVDNIIYMQGRNLGFDSSRIITNPPLVWNLEVASTSYSADYSAYKGVNGQIFQIRYDIPSLEFILRSRPIQFIVTEYTSYPDNSTITFKGLDFVYDISLIQIQIASYTCKPVLSTYSTIECILVDPSSNRIVITEPLEDLITTISITNPDDGGEFKLQLTSSFDPIKILNVQVTPCPNLCNNNGICYSSGQCKCTNPITYDVDCKTGTNCSHPCGLGHCDYSIGACNCPSNWGGDSCSTPYHYITSIDPCTIKGGLVVLHGWFSQFNDNLIVKIGTLECNKKNFNETTIECILGEGIGTKDVNITQNGVELYLKNKFQYINPIQTCLNNCTSPTHGICDESSGICNCLSDWVGYDCSLVKPIGNDNGGNGNGSTTVNNNGTTTTTIGNNGDGYQVSILSLVEFDITGTQVKSYHFNNKFNVTVYNNQSLYYFSHQLNNSECIVSYSIEEVKQESKLFEFANIQFKVGQGGFKLAVNISNYQYTSTLNTLQLRIQSESNYQISSDDCNKSDAETDLSNIDPNLTLNYISLKKNKVVFTARFINKAISDNRFTYMSTEVIKELSNSTNVIIGLNLPNGKLISIDPDFSLLLDSNYQSKCNNSKPKWFLPVVIAVPVGGLSIIIIASVILIKKYKYSIKLLMKSSIKLKERKL